jgi:spore maturation protein CgeB
MRIVICGLSITSSWGNGHATTYRALIRELALKGHEVLFLEYDKPWYADHRDLPDPPYCRLELFSSVEEFKDRFTPQIRDADAVIVGSYVPEGIEIGKHVISRARGLTAFYDIDTPVTLAKLAQGNLDYLSAELISKYQLYLSFTGGPVLQILEKKYGSPCARPLYCSVDPRQYYPEKAPMLWDLGYLGTFSEDRQPTLHELVIAPAANWRSGKFVIAGPQYPPSIEWGSNVERIDHLPPGKHRAFYNSQRFTLNVTRRDMIQAGFSPSVRLFEAAACGVPIISDFWKGLDGFFELGTEILVAESSQRALEILRELPEEERIQIGRRARTRVLQRHTSAHRASDLEKYMSEALQRTSVKSPEERSCHLPLSSSL